MSRYHPSADILVAYAAGSLPEPHALLIATHLSLNPKTIESHVRSIFTKLGLEPEPDDHRRVLAVITYLRADPTM